MQPEFLRHRDGIHEVGSQRMPSVARPRLAPERGCGGAERSAGLCDVLYTRWLH
jgi:hypothetical protein